MTETKYTIEQFELDMENATPSQMEGFLMKALDDLDTSDPLVRESLQKYREEFQDIKEQNDIEDNARCIKDIESGKVKLYTCIKESQGYEVGEKYYVDIEKPMSGLSKETVESMTEKSSEVAEYINGIKPLIWIIKDNGIGTPKKKRLFKVFTDDRVSIAGINQDLNFSDYFEKVSK